MAIMENYNYTPNSNKYKEEKKEERRAQKVVTGEVKVKKKSEAKKFVDTFISEDVSKVKDYILMDVLVPAVKKAISDIVTNGIDMILYGSAGKSKSNSSTTRISYTNYSNPSSQQRAVAQRNVYSYDDLLFNSRGEAEAVLAGMDEIMANYQMVRVSDMNELAGVTGNYTDVNYGWTDIRSAQVIRVRDGYMIKMPRALPLN